VSFEDFLVELNKIVDKRLDDLKISDAMYTPIIQYYYIWKKKEVVAKKNNGLLMSECISLDDESDYEALQHEIRATFMTKKNSLDDMLLYILAIATIINNPYGVTRETTENGGFEDLALDKSPKRTVQIF
jgi:hypothetical protein